MIRQKSKYNFFFIIVIANWFLFWGSINVLPEEIFKFGENILRSINALRLLMPLIMAILLIIYVTVKYSKKIKLEIKYYIIRCYSCPSSFSYRRIRRFAAYFDARALVPKEDFN